MEESHARSKTTRRVTQRALADEANVHVSTVSLSLRNSPLIPEETRKRIQALAQARGYRPDPMIQRFVAAREAAKLSRDRGVIAHVRFVRAGDRSGVVAAPGELYLGANYKALKLGYRLELFEGDLSEKGQERLVRTLSSRGIRGVILETRDAGRGVTTSLFGKRFSVVTVGDVLASEVFNSVLPDHRANLSLVLEALAGRGKREVGLWLDAQSHGERERHQLLTHFLAFNSRHFGLLGRQTLARFGSSESLPSLPCPKFAAVFGAWVETNKLDTVVSLYERDLASLRSCCSGLSRVPDFAYFGPSSSGREMGILQNQRSLGALAMELLSEQLRRGLYGTTPVPRTVTLAGRWSQGNLIPSLDSDRRELWSASIPAAV